MPDPRLVWALKAADVVVVTRADPLGADASDRLCRTVRCEAERAGVPPRLAVLAGGRVRSGEAEVPAWPAAAPSVGYHGRRE